MRRALLPAALIALLAAVVARADQEEALRLTEEGDAALAAGRLEDATKQYRAALAEMPTCVRARYGLGEALLASGDTQGAIVTFREVARHVADGTGIPVAWRAYGPKAKARLDKLDERGKELEKLVDEHVTEVMRVAVKYERKDPDLAERAVKTVLALRPDHKRALEILEKMSAQGAREEQLFDGKQIADWDGGRGQWWCVKDGVIVGDTKGVATYVRTQEMIQGNFDVRMEARITKAYDDVPFVALLGAWTAEYTHSRFGVMSGALTWYEEHGKDRKDRVFRVDVHDLPKPIDPSEWNTYELRYRDDTIHAVVNGREVHKIPRTEERARGYVGILAQECVAEIRKVTVLHR